MEVVLVVMLGIPVICFTCGYLFSKNQLDPHSKEGVEYYKEAEASTNDYDYM